MNTKMVPNNFDLLRLLAATQVALLHVANYLSPSWGELLIIKLLNSIPGVPVFFFISGFLISRSYEKNGNIVEFARNRALRIYPALHVCILINLLLVAATGYFASVAVDFHEIIVLYLAKASIFQFYNPEFMRDFGDGVLNGSLWTICVELQFYFLTPIIYIALSKVRWANANLVILILVVISILCNRALYETRSLYADTVLWKLCRVSFGPWLYMFLWGMLMQRNFHYLIKYVKKYSLAIALPLYLAFSLWMQKMGYQTDNSFSPLLFFPLTLLIFCAAFTFREFSNQKLKGNDISYGIYIYHVPIMNMFLFYSLSGSVSTIATLLITFCCAIASWIIIERPCLSKKRLVVPTAIQAS